MTENLKMEWKFSQKGKVLSHWLIGTGIFGTH